MRLHLFEWLDQPWLPAALREPMRDYLTVAYGMTSVPDAWAAQLANVITSTRITSIVDLGSGAAGPVVRVAQALDARGVHPHVTMTDLFPAAHPPSSTATLEYWQTPVDARTVPPELCGIRTMFAAFHHLRPADAEAVLRDAFERRQPIGVFEATARTPVAILTSVLIPLLVLVLMPKVRPRRLSTLVLTYLVPVLPLLILWDGLVSHLRTYSAAELQSLTASLQHDAYAWTIGELRVPGVPMGLPYLIGRPVER